MSPARSLAQQRFTFADTSGRSPRRVGPGIPGAEQIAPLCPKTTCRESLPACLPARRPPPCGMKIATFNINNVNKRLANLLAWLRAAAPDAVCLQELKSTDAEFPVD